MDDTDCLSSGLINIGGDGGLFQPEPNQWGAYERNQQQQQPPPPSNLLRTMATKIRRDERLQLFTETTTTTTYNNKPVTKNNKFWALQDDDSDEEDSAVSSNRFQFTPASFSLAPPPPSMAGVTTGLVCGLDADDPDL